MAETDEIYFPSRESLRGPVSDQELAQAEEMFQDAINRGRENKEEIYQSVNAVRTSSSIAEDLGVSRRTVNRWTLEGKLIGIRIYGDKRYRYPDFQFVPGGRILDGFETVNEMWRNIGVDPFTRAQYFLYKTPRLNGESAVDVLRSGDSDKIARLHHMAPAYGEMGE